MLAGLADRLRDLHPRNRVNHAWRVLVWWEHDFVVLVRRVVKGISEDHCTQLAASISYYVLFSMFPLAILVVSIAGVVLTDEALRERTIASLLELLPVSFGAGREQLEEVIEPISQGRSAVGLVAVLGLIWSASGMMASLRYALDQVWDLSFRRPFLSGKAFDIMLVAGVGALIVTSVAMTLLLQLLRHVSEDVADDLGFLGQSTHIALDALILVLPAVLPFITFMVVYVVVPSIRVRPRDALPGALLATLLFEILKNSFTIYLRDFASFDAVYGTLGALIALIFFVFLSSLSMLIGAEVAAHWPRVFRKHH